MGIDARAYFLESPGAALALRALALRDPAAGEVVVEVLSCGLCHTDLAFASGSVPPRHQLPLVLGHEVVGTVVAASDEAATLIGRTVLVPAVLPCGRCEFCRAGRGNACPDQKMPGNDVDGGFATHLIVPAAPLVVVDEYLANGIDARELSVVADAVSTAYQAARRSHVAEGDAVLVVGAGGVGGFVAQIARALGARVAVGDVAPDRLALLESHGADRTVDLRGRTPHEGRKLFGEVVRDWRISTLRTRIFECSGTPAGQTLAFSLLGRGSTLLQVGYTPEPVTLRFSNLMAFDATVHGSWGCPPELYPDVLRLIADGRVAIRPFVEHAPMSAVNDLLGAMAAHTLRARMVLNPLL